MSVSSVKININGTDYMLTNTSGNNWTATITAPGASTYNQPGHTISCVATATNSAGTTGTASTALRVKETVAPVITILSPTSGALVTNSQQPVAFTVTDESGGSGLDISSLAIKVDGTTVSTGITTGAITNGYSVTYTPPSALSDGSHTVVMNISDFDGNAATQKSTTFTVDTVAPTLNVTSPTDNAITAAAACVVAGTTNDATSSPVAVAITLNGVSQGNATVTGGSFSKTITLAEGANTIIVMATDGAGKTTSVTRHVTLDSTVPNITSVSISPNPVNAGASMIVTVVVS